MTHRFRLTALSLALATLAGGAAAQQSSELAKISVTGEGDKLGTGLMIDEDTPKAKSTVTRAEIEKLRSSSNPYQALTLLPGVNASSYDATGLFGGNLRVRGFNSDQMGFTINGAPVNDSGNFAVYAQEYTDAENLCEMFVTQGATDTEAPHVGASGGNIGLSTCAPEDQRRVRVALSAGQLNYLRAFVRGDTGKIGDFKGFLSVSKSQVRKWKGEGRADRDHVDAGAEYQLGNTKLSASLLYNRAVNNNFRTLTLAQVGSLGYDADYASAIPQHTTAVNGSAQSEASTASGTAWYGYALNPFENYLLTTKANIQLNPALRLDIEPYYWYGYGTGGVQQTSVAESSGSTKLHGGIADINGDGDTLDTVMVYRGSLTETHRPGVTTKLSYTLDNHHLLGGFWLERARHRQTAPSTTVDNAGNIGDLWLSDTSKLLKHADGSLVQNRDWLTVSTGQSLFVQDSIDLVGGKLQLLPALSWRRIERDFTNYANAGSGGGADYQITQSFSQVLPSLGASWQFTPETQGFASLSKNFRAPSNFELGNAVTSVSYVDGKPTSAVVAVRNLVKQETSVNLDVGARFKHPLFKASVTAFYVDFKDRIAAGYNPEAGGRFDMNVGDSTIKGLEAEIGSVPYKGFSAYASATYTRSTIDQDLVYATASGTSGTQYTAATAGKQFPDTPKAMAALALQWAQGPYLANLSAKYTGRRQVTLVNDQSIGGYTTLDLNLAWQLPGGAAFKNPVLRVNLSNLTDKKYLLANSGSGSSWTVNATGTGAAQPTLYGGAPRFASVTLQSDF